MHETVLSKIAVVLLVFLGGWVARRRGLLDASSVAACSRLVVDVAFPALVLVELPRTVTPAVLEAAWPIPLTGLLVVGGGMLLGRALTRDGTSAFLVGLPNWIFLPLLIADGLYGSAGVRVVLLFNVGAQVSLWTLGVRTLGGPGSLKGLLNPGLAATGAGLALALWVPEVRDWARGGGGGGVGLAGRTGAEALAVVGQICVPLSLFVTGAQLAEQGWAGGARGLPRVLLGRLVVVPALVVGALWLARGAFTPEARAVLTIIAAMPVAISGSLFSQRFGGDAGLAARAVLVSTVLALGTVPGLLWLLGRTGIG